MPTDLCDKINLDEFLQLAAWSETPKHDKAALDLLQPMITLISTRFAAISESSGKLSWKKLPTALAKAYRARQAVLKTDCR